MPRPRRAHQEPVPALVLLWRRCAMDPGITPGAPHAGSRTPRCGSRTSGPGADTSRSRAAPSVVRSHPTGSRATDREAPCEVPHRTGRSRATVRRDPRLLPGRPHPSRRHTGSGRGGGEAGVGRGVCGTTRPAAEPAERSAELSGVAGDTSRTRAGGCLRLPVAVRRRQPLDAAPGPAGRRGPVTPFTPCTNGFAPSAEDGTKERLCSDGERNFHALPGSEYGLVRVRLQVCVALGGLETLVTEEVLDLVE